ncbi:MAG: 6-phosphofructo-2-kinase domain-containing protein [Candidatus Moranbacteria bacterium]|nr:6-phosphofructo-2-kinase domain-containing protein [Candidatus Moranbacteria bacterium]
MTTDTVSAIGIRVTRILILTYFGFGAYLFFNQRNFLYFPALGNPEACEVFAKTGVEKTIKNGTTLYYKKNGGTIAVFYHGNGGTACDRKFLADAFDRNNLSYLFVEYAGYVDDRETTKENIFQDVRNADDFLRTISYEKLAFVSESLGAGPLAYHTTWRSPEKIALIAPYTRISDIAKAHFLYSFYPATLLVRDNFNTALLSEFRGETLVIHGTADEIIPLELGKKLYEMIPSERKEALFVSGATHNTALDAPGVMESLIRFLQSE